MRLTNFLKIIGMLTVIALVYIHMQMRIIELAYEGKKNEYQIRNLIEDNGNLTYAILTLKSSRYLGIKMLSEDSSMDFVDYENVMQISLPPKKSEIKSENNLMALKDKANSILNMISSIGTEAQAQDR